MTQFDGLRWGLSPSNSQVLPKFGNQRQLVRTYYATMFDTVELNASFYRWPKDSTFASWRRRLPEG